MNRERPKPDYQDLSPTHKHIVELAHRRGGVFRFADREEELRRKINARTHGPRWEAEVQRQLAWTRASVSKLVDQGVLHPIDQHSLRLNPDIQLLRSRKQEKPFQPGVNHSKLLALHRDGALEVDALKAELKSRAKSATQHDREWKMRRGMLRNLVRYGYLEPPENGGYRLTERALELLQKDPAKKEPPPPDKRPEAVPVAGNAPKRVSVTAWDRSFLELSKEGRFTWEDLRRHPRGKSLERRVKTLVDRGLVVQFGGAYAMTEELRDRIQVADIRSRGFWQDIGTLSRQQRETVRDIYRFPQLTEGQIRLYLLLDERFAEEDLSYLVRKRIIQFQPRTGVYTLTSYGQRVARQELPEDVKYFGSKSQYRPSEVAHDVLVYHAYQDLRLKLTAQGLQITGFKTDNDLRSDYNAHGLKGYHIPDLRVFYLDREGQERFEDVEIDMGRYTTTQIATKLSAAAGGSMHWYAPSGAAAYRAVQVAVREGFRVVHGAGRLQDRQGEGMKAARTLYVTIVDEDLLHSHRVAFKEGRRWRAHSKKQTDTP